VSRCTACERPIEAAMLRGKMRSARYVAMVGRRRHHAPLCAACLAEAEALRWRVAMEGARWTPSA
jgi:hypothetical protein